MDRFRQKSKKEKPMKYGGKDQNTLYTSDVKSIKENIKIKEILRTVKMNSSMRIKAPRGSKVMQNKDFIDNEDIFESEPNSQNMEHANATNPDVVVNNEFVENTETESNDKTETLKCNESDEVTICEPNDNNSSVDLTSRDSTGESEGISNSESINEEDRQNNVPEIKICLPPPSESSHVKTRDRKLSLDQTMLSRREGLSQSELDLNSIGKSPLERKSSFFRKTMDSFLKNTTEIFKRQSISRSQSIQRRGSMSMSLQSLNENTACNGDYGELLHKHQEELQGSANSLQSSMTAARSGSSMSQSHSERTLPDPQSEGDSLAGSFPVLSGSQPLADTSSHSVLSLNEAYIQDSLLNSRAISMSSGLDAAQGNSRRQKSRSNRVTWLASEGLTNYLRRIIQDEKIREQKDIATIPENNPAGPKTDSKGRRLSYQRAVSGEDPRYHDSLRRKQLILENSEPSYDINELLTEYTKHGVPNLQGFQIADIPVEAFYYLQWAEKPTNLEDVCDWKKLPPSEESRQAVIKELVTTEADYIKHLLAIVEVFIATAHALQDAGKLLDVDTEKLFTNIPDVLNASLLFWESTIFPMVSEACENSTPFDSEIMSPGFMQFREMFHPYEKYVNEQTKALDYLRSLSNNQEFQAYLTWCHSQKACNRLQLSDIMVKPMQRLTKYSLILKRLITHTVTEPERTSLEAMELCAKSYVLDINRSIRQKEELEKMDRLCNALDIYELDCKDDELDRIFRMYAVLNIRCAMINCSPHHSRTIIHEADVRFKDSVKEMEVRVFLLTDMLLICKKLSKTNYSFKLIRPKFMIDKIVTQMKSPRTPKEAAGLFFIILDDFGSAQYAFTIFDSTKDPSGSSQNIVKTWEAKLREARLTYELAIWYTRNPSREVSEMEVDSASEYARSGVKMTTEDMMIDREARERVAAMLHRSMGASTECDFSQVSMTTDSFDGEASMGTRPPTLYNLRHPMKRNSTGGSSRNSRLSSFQKSTSAASHDEPQPGPSRYNYRAGSSVEHIIPPQNPDDAGTSITVNVVSESESETVVHTQQAQTPIVVLQHSSPHKTPVASRSSSTSRNTLRVQPQNVAVALVHSLPDLTLDPAAPPPRPQQSIGPQTASDKLYQSHQELLHKNRLSARQNQHYLSPDHRGSSYPPPSPSRGSLRRGLAFSYSFRYPPLSKMGHVNSQSGIHSEAGPSTSQGSSKGDTGRFSPQPGPSGEQRKGDKKSKSSRQKGSSTSPGSRRSD